MRHQWLWATAAVMVWMGISQAGALPLKVEIATLPADRVVEGELRAAEDQDVPCRLVPPGRPVVVPVSV